MFEIPLKRKLLGQIYYEGRDFEFNFSKFWTGSSTPFYCSETQSEVVWQVTQATRRSKMVVDVRCPKREMFLINYEAPNGMKRHNRLWNCGNGVGRVRLYVRRNGG